MNRDEEESLVRVHRADPRHVGREKGPASNKAFASGAVFGAVVALVCTALVSARTACPDNTNRSTNPASWLSPQNSLPAHEASTGTPGNSVQADSVQANSVQADTAQGNTAPADGILQDHDEVKQKCETNYWEKRFKEEGGRLKNGHYVRLYTDAFDLDASFFDSKKVLDIGCGPRGSLEWMKAASARVCADPLAMSYSHLGADLHDMVYLAAGVEFIPVGDQSFDIVTSINNFDHVHDPVKGLRELWRVLRPGGHVLMLVEIHTQPTVCEPQVLPWSFPEQFVELGFEVVSEKHYETVPRGEFRGSECYKNAEFDHGDPEERDGFLVMILLKPEEQQQQQQ